MRASLIKWAYWLIQSPTYNYPRKQLLCTAILACACISLLASLSNILLALPINVIWLTIICSFSYLLLYLKARFTLGDEVITSIVFCYLSLIFLGCTWPTSGGIAGSVPPTFMGILMLAAFVLPQTKMYLIFCVSTLTLLGSLISVDIFVPGWLTNYTSLEAQKLDMGFGLLIYTLVIGLSLYIFRIRYEAEQQQLKSSVDYKSRFLAQMSHEMRTPLNSIIGFSKILHNETLISPEKTQLYIERIHDNGLSLLGLFEDLLDISNIEAGKLSLNYKEVKLPKLLQQCCSRFEEAAKHKNQRFHSVFSGPYFLYTDPQRLKQMVSNLLSNAVKYTPHNEDIYLSTYTENNSLCIEVKDTGPGIPEIEREQIFVPFYRATHQAEGSGLGLSIVMELCEQMGYTLRLLSKENEGSTFQIWIPLQDKKGPVVS